VEVQSELENLREHGIQIKFQAHGAHSGEFPTIIMVLLGGIAGGMLGAMGTDIWNSLKKYLTNAYSLQENKRKELLGTREPRYNILAAYIIHTLSGIPIIYYSIPQKNRIELEFDIETLKKVEDEISFLIEANLLSSENFLGVNLTNLNDGRYFRLYHSKRVEDCINKELTDNLDAEEREAHLYVSKCFKKIVKSKESNKHINLAK